MKYCIVYKKNGTEERTRFFKKHHTARKRAEVMETLGFKTLIMNKNDFEETYGQINKAKAPPVQVTDMSLLAGGFHNGPPFYNMNHHVNTRGFMWIANPRLSSK